MHRIKRFGIVGKRPKRTTKPDPITEEAYLKLLIDFTTAAEPMINTGRRFARKVSLNGDTYDDAGGLETSKSVSPSQWLVMDAERLTFKEIKAAWQRIADVQAKKWRMEVDNDYKELEGVDFWFVEEDKFLDKYEPVPGRAHEYRPKIDAALSIDENPAAMMVMNVKEGVNWLASWGNFFIAEGGALVCSYQKFATIKALVDQTAKALEGITEKQARASIIREMLWVEQTNPKTGENYFTARPEMDVYGHKPSFAAGNKAFQDGIKEYKL